jgi:hypothetical protein
MHTQRQHAAIEARSREVLDESAGRLDGRTLSRLTQARHAALAQLGEPRNVWWRGWMPAGATAAVAVLAVALFTLRPDTGGLPVATANGEAIDTELLADVEALELAEADDELEFYEWAAREAAATELGS